MKCGLGIWLLGFCLAQAGTPSPGSYPFAPAAKIAASNSAAAPVAASDSPASASDSASDSTSIYSVEEDSVAVAGDSAAKADSARADSARASSGRNDSSRASAPQPNGEEDQGLELDEKIVTGHSSAVHRQKEVSRIRLSRQDLERVAAAQGDPLKVLGTLPGVTNQNDLSVRPFIRGGKAEETQILWDGVPLLQPYHFGTIYSIFNMESLDNLTLYTGGFPAEAGNALSGALFMHSRPAPLDSVRVFGDLSMLRGSTYVGVPLVKNRLGVSLSYQRFWYDWVVQRSLDVADLIAGDSSFSASKQQFRKYLELPNFKDLQLGLNWKLNDKLSAEYVGLFSNDIFHARQEKDRYYLNGGEVSPNFFNSNIDIRKPSDEWIVQSGFDTLAAVSVDNTIHGLHWHWRPNENWEVNPGLAYQHQDWHVVFNDEEVWHDSTAPDGKYVGVKSFSPSTQLLQLQKESWDWNVDAKWQANENHLVKMGLVQSLRKASFNTQLPRPVYEIIVNGSVNLTDGLGYYDPAGLTILKSDPGAGRGIDYLTELPDLVRFDYSGQTSGNFSAGYLSDEWRLDDRHRFIGGLRAEFDSYSGRPFLSPRLAYFQSLGKKDELTLASGLYSQADFSFDMRNVNPNLAPEKAFHFNAEWTHAFSSHYRLETQLYQKNYFDLVVPTLIPTGRMDWGRGGFGFDSADFYQLDPAVQAAMIQRFGEKRLSYHNGGLGKAAGVELSLFYDPLKVWSGWASAEFGYSKRQDEIGERAYDFRYSRPWALNWVNYFHMPSRYELSIRGRFAAGLPYTDFKSPGLTGSETTGDTLFYLAPRNAARYAYYSRWDIRLSKDIRAWGHDMTSYMEVWNAFNTPNFIMRDSETQYWKFPDANYPIPILFLGLSYRW